MTYKVLYTADPSQVTDSPELVATTHNERDARRAAAKALGCDSLRGLAQTPTEQGVSYYAPGADDYDGASVEIRYL